MGDGERRWLTYREVGEALGIKAASAKRLSFRRRWPHRAGNDGLARVGVPTAELRHPPGDTHHAISGDNSETVTDGAPEDKPDASAALALALDRIETLAGQAGHARAEAARLRIELTEAARGQAAAQAAATDARRRAEEAERTALDAWRTAADLAARLTSVRLPPALPQRGSFVTRLLGR